MADLLVEHTYESAIDTGLSGEGNHPVHIDAVRVVMAIDAMPSDEGSAMAKA